MYVSDSRFRSNCNHLPPRRWRQLQRGDTRLPQPRHWSVRQPAEVQPPVPRGGVRPGILRPESRPVRAPRERALARTATLPHDHAFLHCAAGEEGFALEELYAGALCFCFFVPFVNILPILSDFGDWRGIGSAGATLFRVVLMPQGIFLDYAHHRTHFPEHRYARRTGGCVGGQDDRVSRTLPHRIVHEM